MSLLLPLYLGMPWLTMSGIPFIRLDIPARKFYFAGNIFVPQEGHFLFLFLLTAGLSLFFFTSLYGRIWCGWTCPQTVFTELFDTVGRFVLGNKYGKKDANPLLKFLLHFTWIVLATAASFSWIAYFAGPYDMIDKITGIAVISDDSWPWFLAFFAATLYLDMAFVREQFCKYACPYARFQTVMMDDHSVNVTYDYLRGEPRRVKQTKIGDCTACNMCVVVCPTGIDIRNGVQISCISCAKCVDACTKQMAKENKPSLIRYMSQYQADKKDAIVRWIRPRTIVYAILLLVVLSSAAFLYITRIPFQIGVLPDRNIAPMYISQTKVRNLYTLDLQNLDLSSGDYRVSVNSPDFKAPLELLTGEENNIVSIDSNSRKLIRLIVDTTSLTEPERSKKNHFIDIIVTRVDNDSEMKSKKVPFIVPPFKGR